MKEIGAYLKETRINNGVSSEEAAEDLNITEAQIENIESGNVRAFKDVFVLKDLVKMYAKYLGLNSDKIVDEFNDFMFEHTSKISLDDLDDEKKFKSQSNEKKVVSPYTRIPKPKKNYRPLVLGICVFLAVVILIYIIVKITDPGKVVNNELKGVVKEYEFTYEAYCN